MPIHTITFNLPEEREELETILSAGNMASAIYDFGQELRNKTKYDDPGKTVTWGELKDMWYLILAENEVKT